MRLCWRGCVRRMQVEGAAEAYAVCALCRNLDSNSFSGDVKPLANMTGLTDLYYTCYV